MNGKKVHAVVPVILLQLSIIIIIIEVVYLFIILKNIILYVVPVCGFFISYYFPNPVRFQIVVYFFIFYHVVFFSFFFFFFYFFLHYLGTSAAVIFNTGWDRMDRRLFLHTILQCSWYTFTAFNSWTQNF